MSSMLEVQDLSKRFGGFVALEEINLTVAAGERVGLIGPNGSGKSTLVNCICGTLTNDYLLSLGFLKVLNLAVEKVDG